MGKVAKWRIITVLKQVPLTSPFSKRGEKMANLFGTLNISKQGMMAQSFAVNTTSHNISNVNTAGFSRQRVNMQASSPYTYPGVGQLGTGVEISGVQRIRDQFLDAQINYETSIMGRHQASQSVLEQVEMIFLEPSDTGLSESMTVMWKGWQELADYPEKTNTKTIVARSSQSFTDTLNHMALQLDTLKSDTVTTIEGKTYNANELIRQIQEVSDQIYKSSIKNLTPNDLLDKRDLMVEQLSSMINVNVEYDQFSRIEITEADSGTDTVLLDFDTQAPITNELSVIRSAKDLGGGQQEITVVRGGDISNTYTFTVSTTPPNVSFSEGDIVYADPEQWKAYDAGGTPPPSEPILTKANLREGELKGNKDALEKIDEYYAQLDQLASSIAETINLVHRIDASSKDFFTTSDGSTTFNAKNIQVNQDILDDVSLINAGKTTSDPGDGSRALAIAKIKNVNLQVDNSNFNTYLSGRYNSSTMEITSDVSGTTFDSYYNDTVVKIGVNTKQAKDGVDSQTTLMLQLTQRRESVSGVSIDEEVANLIQFQNSYQANAKVISTLTEMLDTLINRMGI